MQRLDLQTAYTCTHSQAALLAEAGAQLQDVELPYMSAESPRVTVGVTGVAVLRAVCVLPFARLTRLCPAANVQVMYAYLKAMPSL